MRKLSILLAATIAVSSASASPKPPDPGALVATTAQSTVGVLLDEIPVSMRQAVAAQILNKPSEFWKQRAARQLRLTNHRLVSRKKGQLALPPEPLWTIELLGPPRLARVGTHDLVVINYAFSSTLLTGLNSPDIAEPRLKKTGGVWSEPFVLPLDPEMLLQRTGFACMDEEDFPFNSVDSEEVDSFYDQECATEKGLTSVGQCHFTQQPAKSCLQALEDHVGKVETAVKFERLPWAPALADQVRFGKVTGDESDLEVYLPKVLPSRITYRYIPRDGCEIVEQCVSGSGWRRLLQFGTSDENVGNKTLTIGGVDYTITGHSGELDSHNLFEYSSCHNHYHFEYYGDLRWQGNEIIGRKQAFCLQSTLRTSNREGSPLQNQFASCDFQGIEVGWADQYQAGLPCQWLDITNVLPGRGIRSFRSNPLGFLCEGMFIDANGNPIGPKDEVVWTPTGLIGENGQPVEKPLCRLSPSWDANNESSVEETIPLPGEGLITTPCTRGQIGPARNCGFVQSSVGSCAPGEIVTVTLPIPPGGAPQVVRICEYSQALNSAIPCRYEESWVPLAPGVSDQPYTLANTIVSSSPATVTFRCPAPRTTGVPEAGGKYSIYVGPLAP